MKLKLLPFLLFAFLFVACQWFPIDEGNPSIEICVVNNSSQTVYLEVLSHGATTPIGTYLYNQYRPYPCQVNPSKESSGGVILDLHTERNWHSVFYDQPQLYDSLFIVLLEQPVGWGDVDHIPYELGVLKIDTITPNNVDLSAKSYTITYP